MLCGMSVISDLDNNVITNGHVEAGVDAQQSGRYFSILSDFTPEDTGNVWNYRYL